MKMPHDDGCPRCDAPLVSKLDDTRKIRLSWLTCTNCSWSQRFEAVALSSHHNQTEAG